MAIQKTLHLHQKRGVRLEIIGVILCDIINHGKAHEINACIVFAFKSALPHKVYT